MSALGDTVHLAASNVDDVGNPLDPAAGPSLTITQPDGTQVVLTGSVTHPEPGQWYADFVPAQSGRHTARWVGTGAGAFAFVEAFTVDPLDDGLLFPLREARAALGWAPDDSTDYDAELRDYAASVTPIIEDIVGPILPRACDEWQDGGRLAITLDWHPVLAIVSVTESWGSGTSKTLTEQVIDTAGPFDVYGYSIDKRSGILTRRAVGVASPFVAGRRNIHVVYTAGQTPANNVIRAAKVQLRYMWELDKQANRPAWGDEPDTTQSTDSGYAVPPRVVQLCGGVQRNIGIA